jgi:predicted RNA polymerase sigma factor
VNDANDSRTRREVSLPRLTLTLAGQSCFHAKPRERPELHASLGHLAQARAFLDRALALQTSVAERALLERKRAALDRAQ